MRVRLIPLLLWIIALASTAYARQFAVIADTSNTSSNIASAELVKIVSGHFRNWPDGKPIKMVLRDPSSPEMELAARKLFNMTGDKRALSRGLIATSSRSQTPTRPSFGWLQILVAQLVW